MKILKTVSKNLLTISTGLIVIFFIISFVARILYGQLPISFHFILSFLIGLFLGHYTMLKAIKYLRKE